MGLQRPSPIALVGLVLAAPVVVAAQQVADTVYAPAIPRPQYEAGAGPVVAIDAAHLNFHTADGRFLPFARLLERDGYRVVSNDEAFTVDGLRGIDVLVISNALHPQSARGWAPLPSLPAFTAGEVAALEAWVSGGGSLLLIADHMPIAGHAESLAAAFGIRFQNGFAMDAASSGSAVFRRADGSLRASVATDGLESSERVDSVMTFTGQAFRVDPGVDAEPLMVFSDAFTLYLTAVAFQFSEGTPRISAAHMLQGVLVRHGRGRVAAFGEAAMFTAQLAGPQQVPMGMNHPAAGQNYRFALNVLRWLSEGR